MEVLAEPEVVLLTCTPFHRRYLEATVFYTFGIILRQAVSELILKK